MKPSEKIQFISNWIKSYVETMPNSAESLVIGISGGQKGVVYFSATRQLLSSILDSMGEADKSEENYIDLAGEVANTISGNARKEFGSEFHISVPFVFKGAPQSIVLPNDERSFIIPITWHSQVGEIVVCLQD